MRCARASSGACTLNIGISVSTVRYDSGIGTRRRPSSSYERGTVARVATEPAELLGPAVPHPTPGEQLLLELLLHGRDVEQLE